MTAFPLHRFLAFLNLSETEVTILRSLSGAPREFPRQSLIQQQGEQVDHIYLLFDGWVLSCMDLRDGQRQVVKIHLPGDVMAAPSLALASSAESLLAVTNAMVGAIPLATLGQLFEEAPRLGAAFFLSSQQERVILMDRMTSIGRMPALARLAALIVHVQDRLAETGRVDAGGRMEWPLTQQHMGDILGLTPVHINRMMHDLREAGLVVREQTSLTVPDLPSLRNAAMLPEREWVQGPGWLEGIGAN